MATYGLFSFYAMNGKDFVPVSMEKDVFAIKFMEQQLNFAILNSRPCIVVSGDYLNRWKNEDVKANDGERSITEHFMAQNVMLHAIFSGPGYDGSTGKITDAGLVKESISKKTDVKWAHGSPSTLELKILDQFAGDIGLSDESGSEEDSGLTDDHRSSKKRKTGKG